VTNEGSSWSVSFCVQSVLGNAHTADRLTGHKETRVGPQRGGVGVGSNQVGFSLSLIRPHAMACGSCYGFSTTEFPIGGAGVAAIPVRPGMPHKATPYGPSFQGAHPSTWNNVENQAARAVGHLEDSICDSDTAVDLCSRRTGSSKWARPDCGEPYQTKDPRASRLQAAQPRKKFVVPN